jgi:mono/diheme cytochrome c family protein
MAQGLNPEAPDLAEDMKEMSPPEIFWVVKNGIRMTGMPGWGETHSDEQLWEIVSFLIELPEMSVLDYLFLNSDVPLDEDDGHGHDH